MKFEIDKFSRRNNFNIWKIQIMALLQRKGLLHAINEKYLDDTSDSNKEKIEGDAFKCNPTVLAPNMLLK